MRSSGRLVDGLTIGFALWTISCHATISTGGSLHRLLVVFAVLGTAAGVAVWRGRRAAAGREPVPSESKSAHPAPEAHPGQDGWVRWLRMAAFVAAASAILFLRPTDVFAVWWGASILLALAFASEKGSPVPSPPALSSIRRERLLWALAAACVILSLTAHRMDTDDAYYVHLAVTTADRPTEPMLAGDSLHGVEGLPVLLPVYRLHTFEHLAGAVSYLSGVPAIHVMHWMLAALAAFLVPLAFARLFRVLLPRHWLWATFFAVVLLALPAEPHRWYGSLAFIRIWQGKAVALFVFLPLVYAYGLRYGLRPSKGRWILLAAAQISAVGCTATALWMAPLAAGLGLASAVSLTRAGLARLVAGVSSSAYVLAAGWVLKLDLGTFGSFVGPELAPGVKVARSWQEVFGEGPWWALFLAVVFAAWASRSPGLARRFAIVAPLAVLAVLLNPYLELQVTRHVTGPSYWRALWGLPLPALAALLLTAPLQARGRWRRAGTFAVVGLAVGLAATADWSDWKKGLGLRSPALKVEEDPYRWAEVLNRYAAGAQVIAPPEVSVWIPTFHGHALPLAVREPYLSRYREQLGVGEVRERVALSRLAGGSGLTGRTAGNFRDGLLRYDVRGVCLRATEAVDNLRTVLRDLGFEEIAGNQRYEIWIRS